MDGAICRIRAIVLAVISTALLSGCPINTKRVLIVGDSITLMSAGEITRVGNEVVDTDPNDPEPNNRLSFTILANIGIGARRTLGEPSDPDEYWSGILSSSIQPGNFDAVVVALGTNDCHLLSEKGDYSVDIARIVGAISAADPDVPVFWLTVPDYPALTVPDYPALPGCGLIVNDDLEQIIQAGTYPNLKSLDYNAWAGAHPECFHDGVHLRERWRKDPRSGGANLPAPSDYCVGQFKYASWIKEQLDSFFGPQG